MSQLVMKQTYITAILVYLCLISSHAQDQPVSLDRMSVYSWAEKNGLDTKNITSIIQSRDGYLWLTTYSGIIKFDGYQSQYYNRQNLPFLTIDAFRTGVEAPDEPTLYFASQGSGVIVYENFDFKPLRASNGKVPKSINYLHIEENKQVYIGSNNGLYLHENDEIKLLKPSIFKNMNVVSMKRDRHNTLWIATQGHGLYSMDENGNTRRYGIENGLQSNVINSIEIDDNQVYVGTQAGVSIVKNKEVKPLRFMVNQSINTIVTSDHLVWIGSNNGLGLYDLISQTGTFTRSLGATTLTRINNIHFDKEGSMWICTGRDGLVQLRQTGISNYTTYDGLSSNKINIIKNSYQGDKQYIGCDDGNLFYFRQNEIERVPLQLQASQTGIRDVLEESDGTLWIASYRGVIRKSGNEEVLYDLNNGLNSLDIRVIHKDQNGNIWLGSRSGGLAKIVDDKVIKIYDENNGLKSNFILSIDEDSTGNLFVGTHSGGLTQIKPDGDIINHTISENDAGLIIFNTHIDQRGYFWAVCNSGIYLFHNGQFIQLKLKHNLSGVSMFDWLEGPNQNAWITSSKGVINIPKSEIDKFLEDEDYILETSLINSTDGMREEECTGAVQSVADKSGKLWIPTIDGVSVINTELLRTNTIAPPVYITSLMADTTTYENKNNFVIPAGHIRYIINFTALSYISPEEMKFRYKLENFDDNYVEVTNERQVEYTNLPPGKYTFRVMASNNDGIWNEVGDEINFSVAAFYYQTTWFYVLLIIGISALLFSIYKWRIHGIEKMNVKLRKVNSELDSFVYSASHDLRSPLASLLGLIDLAEIDKSHINSYLDKMKTSVKKLDAFIGDIIDFSSNERKEVMVSKFSLPELIDDVLDELHFLNHDDNVSINKSFEGESIFASDRRRVAIILRNLISNALKYKDSQKPNPVISINIHCDKVYTSIEIDDNGIGIEKHALRDIFKMFFRATENSSGSGLGLYIVKETVEKLQGTITVESVVKKGTTFTITLPNLLSKAEG